MVPQNEFLKKSNYSPSFVVKRYPDLTCELIESLLKLDLCEYAARLSDEMLRLHPDLKYPWFLAAESYTLLNRPDIAEGYLIQDVDAEVNNYFLRARHLMKIPGGTQKRDDISSLQDWVFTDSDVYQAHNFSSQEKLIEQFLLLASSTEMSTSQISKTHSEKLLSTLINAGDFLTDYLKLGHVPDFRNIDYALALKHGKDGRTDQALLDFAQIKNRNESVDWRFYYYFAKAIAIPCGEHDFSAGLLQKSLEYVNSPKPKVRHISHHIYYYIDLSKHRTTHVNLPGLF